jgi:hypothetical protein
MTHTMSIRYETVKYYSGQLAAKPSSTVVGFADPDHYDTVEVHWLVQAQLQLCLDKAVN